MTRTLIALLLTLLLGAPALASAAPPPPPPAGDDQPDGGEQHEKLMERIRVVRLYALTEALDLDEATAAKLFPYLRTYDEEFKSLHKKKRKHRRALRKMVKDEAYDAKQVAEHTSGLSDIEVEMAELRRDRMAGLDGILDAEQQAKYVMVQERIENEIRSIIREHRRGKRERRGGGERMRGPRNRR